MFLSPIRVRKSGKWHTYWAILRSVRTLRGPRHQLVSYLGELSQTEQRDYARIRRIVAESQPVQLQIFDKAPASHWVKVHTAGMRLERVRRFGGVWLALKLWSTLEFDRLMERCLPDRREEIRWGLVGCILAIARFEVRGASWRSRTAGMTRRLWAIFWAFLRRRSTPTGCTGGWTSC